MRWNHIPAGLYLLFAERLPQYLDWDLFGGGSPSRAAWPRSSTVGPRCSSCGVSASRSGREHPLRHAALFPIFFVIFVLLFAASIHIRRSAPQYVVPLSAFFPVALAFWLVHAPRRWKLLVWAGGAALFVLHGWTTTTWVVRRRASRRRADGRLYLQPDRPPRGHGGDATLYSGETGVRAAQLLRPRADHRVADDGGALRAECRCSWSGSPRPPSWSVEDDGMGRP